MERFLRAVVWTLCALSVMGAQKKAFVCAACHDTGKVAALCPLCHGSKWMWKCEPKGGGGGKGWATYEVLSNDGDGIRTTEGWCGYGTTYKALHRSCPNVRRRVACPNCPGAKKGAATGKIRVACPDCDGKGHMRTVYYIVRDTSALTDGRRLELSVLRELIERRKLTPDELAEYRTEHSNSKVYVRLDELLRAVKTWDVTVARGSQDRTVGVDSAEAAAEPVAVSEAAVAQPVLPTTAPAQPISEAIRRLIEIEEAHEREMFKRKFGGW